MSATRSLDDTQPIPVVRGRHAAPKGARSPARRALVLAREVGIVVAGAAVLLVGARLIVGQVVYVADDAMAPTLAPGERVLVSPWGDPVSGDVVLVASPEGWGAPDGEAIVRVIATGGQRVACCDDGGRLTVDGSTLDEPYLAGPTNQVEFDVEVPTGRVFLLADDRSTARDSRAMLEVAQGTLAVEDVRGRVIAVLWPPRAVDD
jgi:signal peptidase I